MTRWQSLRLFNEWDEMRRRIVGCWIWAGSKKHNIIAVDPTEGRYRVPRVHIWSIIAVPAALCSRKHATRFCYSRTFDVSALFLRLCCVYCRHLSFRAVRPAFESALVTTLTAVFASNRSTFWPRILFVYFALFIPQTAITSLHNIHRWYLWWKCGVFSVRYEMSRMKRRWSLVF